MTFATLTKIQEKKDAVSVENGHMIKLIGLPAKEIG
jgi:hypothetical protein